LRAPERAADQASNFQARNSTTRRPPPLCPSTCLCPEGVGASGDLGRVGCGHQGAGPLPGPKLPPWLEPRPTPTAIACRHDHCIPPSRDRRRPRPPLLPSTRAAAGPRPSPAGDRNPRVGHHDHRAAGALARRPRTRMEPGEGRTASLPPWRLDAALGRSQRPLAFPTQTWTPPRAWTTSSPRSIATPPAPSGAEPTP
jgi:hypothetical protein